MVGFLLFWERRYGFVSIIFFCRARITGQFDQPYDDLFLTKRANWRCWKRRANRHHCVSPHTSYSSWPSASPVEHLITVLGRGVPTRWALWELKCAKTPCGPFCAGLCSATMPAPVHPRRDRFMIGNFCLLTEKSPFYRRSWHMTCGTAYRGDALHAVRPGEIRGQNQ